MVCQQWMFHPSIHGNFSPWHDFSQSALPCIHDRKVPTGKVTSIKKSFSVACSCILLSLPNDSMTDQWQRTVLPPAPRVASNLIKRESLSRNICSAREMPWKVLSILLQSLLTKPLPPLMRRLGESGVLVGKDGEFANFKE